MKQSFHDSDFSKFLYYIVCSCSKVGPNATYATQFPGSIVLDVDLIHDALHSSPEFNGDLLLEVLYGRTNEELSVLQQCYQQKHGRSLNEELGAYVGENSFTSLFQCCLKGCRDENPQSLVDEGQAKLLVDSMMNEGLKQLWESGLSSMTGKQFIEMLAYGSDNQLNCVSQLFYRITLQDLTVVVEQSLNKAAAKAINGRLINKYTFLAKSIHESLTERQDHSVLARILGRSFSYDHAGIGQAYEIRYRSNLLNLLDKELSCDKWLLIAVKAYVYQVQYANVCGYSPVSFCIQFALYVLNH